RWDVIKNRNVPLTWTNQSTTQTSASKTLTIIPHQAAVSEMERSRAVLLTLVCVLFSRISGSEVEMRVRPGDNVVLYSDCVWEIDIVWFRNSSYGNQTPFIISANILRTADFSRYCFVWNQVNQTRDLLVKNVSESDLGLYYCAFWEKKFIRGVQRDFFRYGTRTTRLSLLDSTVPCADPPQTPSTPPVSDCSVCWKLLVSVCPVCVLLSSVVSSTCVYCFYRSRTKCSEVGGADGGADGVVYTPVNITSRRQDHLKKNRLELSDICTYSEVKHGQR
ncbi:hypothetical protein NFI96_032744, partial [Prochilodus magdalenae]